MGAIESLSAITLATAAMAPAVHFYDSVGFECVFGGPDAPFTTFRAGTSYLNLQLDPDHAPVTRIWGRAIFWVADVDALYERVCAAGYQPTTVPADAPWGERFFHVHDPDGHEISFARPR